MPSQDVSDPSLIHKLLGLKEGANDVAFHPNLPLVAAASNDGAVLTWDIGHPNIRAYK